MGFTLKVTARSRKGLKNLPPTIELPDDATVEFTKKAIASATKTSDFNRIGIFDPVSKKTLKDRNALVKDSAPAMKAGEIMVKDLGPQISWQLVYQVEYLGPLLFHPLFYSLRNYIYPALSPYVSSYVPEPTPASAAGLMSYTQKVTFFMIMAHFIKRELEVLYVHKFSANTMPAPFIIRNSFFYWVFAGFLGALEIYSPWAPAASVPDARTNLRALPLFTVGMALFFFGEIANANVHSYLSSLRKPGETARKIPNGLGFKLVTCPNYMFEVIAWIGIILVTRSPTLVVFILIGTYYMYIWGVGKEKAYRKEFGDKYKKKRYVMLPGLL
ncbi:3-oxo-5-alpha-steroid 4-dehydrogenase-domain-containing protein [Xylariaceae sp. FL0255]|nr:3-oxo-5-alpha-steroid 4-dehydrogenase-domain-containing protein [Xylariaceae sp. FL0255]